MCYTATQVTNAKTVKAFYGASSSPAVSENFEINLFKALGFDHPQLMAVMDREGGRTVDLLQWGLMPNWNRPLGDMLKLAKGTLNARAESVRTAPSFKASLKKQRCIIPVNSFFEYKHVFDENGKKTDTLPYLIHPREKSFFSLAGVYSFYKNPENGVWIKTFSIITEPANTFMADIHNSAKRMPLMLDTHLIGDWLNPDSPDSMIDEILQFSCDDSSMDAYRVIRNLKNAPNDETVLKTVSL